MAIEDRLSSITTHPVTRIIEVSQQSLDRAMRHRESSEIAHQHHASHVNHTRRLHRQDEVQANRQVNDLSRENAWLKRVINDLLASRIWDEPNITLASPPDVSTRNTPTTFEYVRYELPPDQPAAQAPVILPLLQTNTGTLIDLLT
ncbi:MAG: hypothetical protein O7G85_14800 [Planctomycetota bacterium]|nr:hypothetical protein [Planctomycetota bacterium]